MITKTKLELMAVASLSPGWARVPLSLFFLKLQSIFPIFPQTLLIFFYSPTREGPGYATA